MGCLLLAWWGFPNMLLEQKEEISSETSANAMISLQLLILDIDIVQRKFCSKSKMGLTHTGLILGRIRTCWAAAAGSFRSTSLSKHLQRPCATASLLFLLLYSRIFRILTSILLVDCFKTSSSVYIFTLSLFSPPLHLTSLSDMLAIFTLSRDLGFLITKQSKQFHSTIHTNQI